MAESSTFDGQVRGGGEGASAGRLDDFKGEGIEEEGVMGSTVREAGDAAPLDLESKDLRRSICMTAGWLDEAKTKEGDVRASKCRIEGTLTCL
jgi:hypothetical protein